MIVNAVCIARLKHVEGEREREKERALYIIQSIEYMYSHV